MIFVTGVRGQRCKAQIVVNEDTDRQQIVVYDPKDRYVTAFGEPDQFRPIDVAIADERLYVTDAMHHMVHVLDKQSGDWKQDQAYNIMATALRNNEKIDLVYGHNDPMAYGAYLAAKDVGRDKDIKFIGIDALPNEGVQLVNKGELTATFLYATPGAEGLRQALKYLAGEKVEKTVILPTLKITKENAPQILKDNGL